VGAGSVVTGVLPDHCVAVGSPAKVVKRYTPADGWRATDMADKETLDVAPGTVSRPSGPVGRARPDQKLAGSNGLTAPKKKKSTTSEIAPPVA
jgi:hypothetical protein